MSASKMIKTIYKSMFKIASKYDKNPTAKSLLYRLPAGSNTADSVFRSAAQVYFNSIMDKVLGRNRLFYHPSRMDQSLKAIVRKEFRNNKSKISLTSRIDVGFSVLRQLTTHWVSYEQERKYHATVESLLADPTDVSSFSTSTEIKKRNSKKSCKIDVSTAPATVQEGVIVAAHPMIHGDLHRALVLVVEHNENFSYGVILNKAETQHSIRSGVSGLRLDGFYDAFGENPLFFGGNVRRLCHMHTIPESGGVPVANAKTTTKLYMHGSIEKAIQLVNDKSTAAKSSDFYFFAGACFWEAGQLQQQVLEGTWLPVHAPVDALLHMSLQESEIGTSINNGVEPEDDANSTKAGADISTTTTTVNSTGESVHSIVDDGFNTVEEDERERLNRVWSEVMHSASRNCRQISSVPFTLHSASVEPMMWTESDNAY